jgi:hypothetical protein
MPKSDLNKATPSSKTENRDIQEIDALFEHAGLVRNLHDKAAGVTRRVRFERAEPQELSRTAPDPQVAANGAEWLAVPDWQMPSRAHLNWLWHGFSTRRGGVSRAYCADNAPGELNLGFTDADSREAVTENRRLFAAAVSGVPDTPLVTLRQIQTC